MKRGSIQNLRVILTVILSSACAGGTFSPQSGVTQAQPRATLDDRAQSIVEAAFESFRIDSGPGCVGAIQRGGLTVALGAGGLASLEYQVPLRFRSQRRLLGSCRV